MSLVLPSREVAAGPTVVLKSQGAPAPVAEAASPPVGFVGVPVYLRVAGDKWKVPPAGKEAVGKGAVVVGFRNGFGGLGGRKTSTGCVAAAAEEEEEGEKDADSSESSSIGEGGESSLSLSSSTAEDRGDGEEEVQSKLRKDALVSLNSLEESLPIKRGLSNCFSGKSKSFANLSDAAALGTSARDLAKAENPFNKRRRILMACKASWQRRASYAALNTSNLWALEEGEEYHDVDDGKHGGRGDDGGVDGVPNLPPPSPSRGRKHVKAFRTPRSFSLTDLQHA